MCPVVPITATFARKVPCAVFSCVGLAHQVPRQREHDGNTDEDFYGCLPVPDHGMTGDEGCLLVGLSSASWVEDS